MQNRTTLEEALSFIEKRLANLDIWGPPDGAEMYLDGERVGAFPFAGPQRVPAGNPELMIKAKGFATVRRPLELKAGTAVREHVVLRPFALDLPPPGTESPPPPAQTGADKTAAPSSTTDEGERSILTRWWFWTAVGVVAAGAGVAGYALLHKSEGCPSSASRTCSSYTP